METVGNVLVLVGLVIVLISAFVPHRYLLTVGVFLIGLGVLFGADGFVDINDKKGK